MPSLLESRKRASKELMRLQGGYSIHPGSLTSAPEQRNVSAVYCAVYDPTPRRAVRSKSPAGLAAGPGRRLRLTTLHRTIGHP
jgi:hypothetical protein